MWSFEAEAIPFHSPSSLKTRGFASRGALLLLLVACIQYIDLMELKGLIYLNTRVLITKSYNNVTRGSIMPSDLLLEYVAVIYCFTAEFE